MLKNSFKVFVLLAFIFAVEYFFGWSELFELVKQIANANENSLPIFLILMSIGCAFAFPLSFCYLFAGTAFGFWVGWGVCVAILAISSAVGYCLGRFFLPESLMSFLSKKFGVDSYAYGRSMFNANFFVRVFPGIPYVVQNIILGGMRSGFGLYIFVNLVAQGAIAGAMNFFASSLNNEGYLKYIAFGILVLALSLFHISANIVYKKRAKR